ncbi:hypothetical protein MKW98_013301 [Papaver atlanticum]|uniref:Cation efflux protein cytoplasmic domain-containing protein n=1 Tax=Papaver atlanticum TaxID=357466 RepID=A0AAD4XEY0_9MAGN|nr:hypothetical protein MKX03_025513 [Papaver bracteatum]KAI3906347.1 hypothetical protein MKW98_013301 [Papaver atlanticum]
MVDPIIGDGISGDTEERLLPDDNQWRLNFNDFERYDHQGRRGTTNTQCFHKCLEVLAPEDVVATYYQQQVQMLDGFSEMDALTDRDFLPGMTKEEQENLAKSENLAIRISNIANMLLFAGKVFASVQSGSLSIIASTLDSLLDLLSGFILWFTSFSMQTPNPYRYPIGKKRMQPLGIIVFASVMATLGLQIILESVRTLITHHDFNLTKVQQLWVIGIMCTVTLVKFCLMLYCRTFSNEIVKAYAQDHFFDVVTNIIGLVAAILANYFKDWMDPVGAIILALYTIRTWSSTVLENVNSLVGRSAAPEYLQKLTYLCWNHHKAIMHIDTVRAYTFGSHYFVEVDIVLPSAMPLREAHDVGESLQIKLERLPEIERAFVHLDYEFTHKPEHAQS